MIQTAKNKVFDVKKIRDDFPILKTLVYVKPLVYLDNAATTQKPLQVIETIERYYRETNSNVHRGIHFLSDKATGEYEFARERISKFINAEKSSEIIFVRGTTEGINLVASSFGNEFISEGDEIIISAIEHHSNIVPWQMLCERKKANLKIIPVTDTGELEIDKLQEMITGKTKLVSVVHISNSLGTINPIKEIIRLAHSKGVPVFIDGAQSVPHFKIDVQELDCDFFAFSGHKIYGPTGIGVLYGKEMYLEKMPPYQGGGDMIKDVKFEKTTYNDLPYKFEAGTPDISGAIGLAAAFDYINKIGMDEIANYEKCLLNYATDTLSRIENIRIIGTAQNKSGVISFLPGNVHPYDAGTLLDRMGIAIRTGQHCTQPIMDRFGIPGTVRASFAFYNTKEEIDYLAEAIKKVFKMFG